MKEIYKVVLTDVHLGLNNNFTPYVELKFETSDNNKLNLRSKYYFTNKAKYFAYKELSDLLEAFDIKTDTDSIFDDLKYLIGAEMYLVKTKKLEFYMLYWNSNFNVFSKNKKVRISIQHINWL